MEKNKVYIVYDHGDGNISRVFDNKEAARDWITDGDLEGWLVEEDCSIYEEEIYSTAD